MKWGLSNSIVLQRSMGNVVCSRCSATPVLRPDAERERENERAREHVSNPCLPHCFQELCAFRRASYSVWRTFWAQGFVLNLREEIGSVCWSLRIRVFPPVMGCMFSLPQDRLAAAERLVRDTWVFTCCYILCYVLCWDRCVRFYLRFGIALLFQVWFHCLYINWNWLCAKKYAWYVRYVWFRVTAWMPCLFTYLNLLYFYKKHQTHLCESRNHVVSSQVFCGR